MSAATRPVRIVAVGGSKVELSPVEADLYSILARQPGVVLTRAELAGRAGIGERVLDARCASLAQKLLRATGARRVVNVWGVGYRLEVRLVKGNGWDLRMSAAGCELLVDGEEPGVPMRVPAAIASSTDEVVRAFCEGVFEQAGGWGPFVEAAL